MSKEPEKRAGRWWVGALSWAIAIASALWAIVVWSPAFLVGRAAEGDIWGWYWIVDVIAALASPSVALLAVLVLVSAICRRWVATGLVLVSTAAVLALPLSVDRLERAPKSASDLRLLTYNSWTGSKDISAKEAMFREADADVIAILEPSLALAERYVWGGGVLDGYASGWKPEAAWGSCPFLMTRLGVVSHDAQSAELRSIRRRLWDHFYRLEIVRTPTGDVAVVQVHARSPRGPDRWMAGLTQLLMVADIVRELEAHTGLPIVVVGDFNSPPSGLRARAFARRSGLVRAKPALWLGGSYPSWAPSVLSLSIDDVYASPGVRVSGWRVLGSAGSDHRAVIVDLSLDQLGSGSEP